MLVVPWIKHVALTSAALFFLNSCGLRLPVKSEPVYAPVAHVAPKPKLGPDRKPVPQDPDVLIWLLADKLHTGMVFPFDWLVESGFVPPEGFGNPRFVSMSWGNRDAYVEKRWLSPWKVMRALFTPSPSVMELIEVDWDVAEVVPHQRIYRRLTDRKHGPEIAEFLNQCTIAGANHRPVTIGPSSWGKGVLLESPQHYFFPRICNVWTAQAIEACGGEMNPWLALGADGVVKQAERPPNHFEKIWDASWVMPKTQP